MTPSQKLRMHAQMDKQIQQQKAQIMDLIGEKQHLAEKLKEQEEWGQRLFEYADNENKNLRQNLSETIIMLKNKQVELLQSYSSWEERYTAMEKKCTQALNKQGLKTEVTPGDTTARQFEDEKQELVTHYSKIVADREQWASHMYHRLHGKIKELTQKLFEADNLLTKAVQPQSDTLCHEKCTAQIQLMETKLNQMEGEKKELKDKFAKDLSANDQRWESKIQLMETKVQQAEVEKIELEDKFAKHLSANDQGWESKIQLMETKVKQAEGEKIELEDKFAKHLAANDQGWESKIQLMETKVKQAEGEKIELEDKFAQHLAANDQSWESKIQLVETKVKQAKGEKIELENKFAKHLAANDQTWEKLLMKYQQDLFQLEEQVDQKKTEVLNLSNEKEGLFQELRETTSQLTSKGGELLLTEAAWQKRFNELKDNEEQQRMESHEQVNQLKQEMHLRDSEILDLSKKNDSLSLTLTETTSQLQSKEAELSQSDRAWRDKHDALEDRMTRALAEKDQSLDSLTLKMHLRVSEILDLSKKNDSLSLTLTETTSQLQSKEAELSQSDRAWRDKHDALEDRMTRALAEKDQSLDSLTLKMHLRDSEILDLSKKNDSLSLTLTETTSQLQSKEAELSQSDRAWQDKHDALEDRMTRSLAEKDQSLDSLTLKMHLRVSEILDLSKKNDSLSLTLTETTSQLQSKEAELSQSDRAWRDKHDALEDRMTRALAEKEQSLDSLTLNNQESASMVEELLQLCKEKDRISKNFRETADLMCTRGDELLERCKALTNQSRKMVSTKQEEQTEKKEKKKKGCFSWFCKKTCADDTRVVEEANDCSAQAGQQ